MIKTVIIDDHELSRYGINVLLTAAHDIEICGEAETASEGLKLIKTYTPHIALVNLHLQDDSGIEVVKRIKQVSSITKIVIFNAQAMEDSVREAFAAGTDSYCTRTIAKEKLAEAIYVTHKGGNWLDSAIAKILIQNLQLQQLVVTPSLKIKRVCRQYSLSSRELEILQMIAIGDRNNQIANKLFLSVGTVRSHVHRILTKLDCQNRAQAATKAIVEGLIDSPETNQIGLTA
ncbi:MULTISPECIES: response regulator transcription factor [Nostocaceae]|jgi:DNA-binding NarL/FixJ family response regulator|uniref:DNA-binding response regulator n=2 Tax=Nostocaceae TaxID=1162 RepID=A0A3S5K2Y4_ANAVA|nr:MULTISPECIES: response regulator transcription factor [Nostocaceae]MBD2568714.1 response regulator transcription factor [Anabaena lutea FACHB-196]MBD2628919.1 response regulator transcription factor [Trichormus variabilis FACHB-164]RUS94588.1 DNA-binding response regulator [Trichormus variabilis SAG 1403-4b]